MDDGAIEKTSTQLVWVYDLFAVTSEFVADWSRLQKNPLIRCKTGLDPINAKGIYQAVSLSDIRTFRPSFGGNKGSFVPAYKKEYDLQLIWRNNLDEAKQDGLVSGEVAFELAEKFGAFVLDYTKAIDTFTTSGASSESMFNQLKQYAELLTMICTKAKGDSNRKLLLRPLLEIGAVAIDADVATVVIAPWHPLRMAAIARKSRLVGEIIQRLLTEKQVEFGDQRLYFKELIRELEHPPPIFFQMLARAKYR